MSLGSRLANLICFVLLHTFLMSFTSSIRPHDDSFAATPCILSAEGFFFAPTDKHMDRLNLYVNEWPAEQYALQLVFRHRQIK